MFALVRIHVPVSVYDAKNMVERRVADNVWDHIAKNHGSWKVKGVRPLYMTRRDMQEDTSLILDVKDTDALTDFLVKHIAHIKCVRGIWVINLAKMRFFRVPPDLPRDFSRFTITIDAEPRQLETIYDSVSELSPGRDIAVNYLTHTFQSFHASVMVSVLARSRNHLNAFVDHYIRPLEGVVEADITRISKTMRLVSPEVWEKSVGPYLVAPGGKPIKDIDADDDSLIAAC